MNEIGIDIETKSSVSITSGVYKYVESKDFAIILFAYKINDSSVVIIDLTKDKLPDHILTKLTSPDWTKTAWNAAFERTCINAYFNLSIPADQWDCTMVRASLLSLPLSLDECSKVLKTSLKDKKGKALIKLFSEKMMSPLDKPDEWEQFKAYCVQDVVTEQDIRGKIIKFKIHPFERKIWLLDQKINTRGLKVDKHFINNALLFENAYTLSLINKAKQISGLENPSSVAQLKKWIFAKSGIVVKSLSKGVTVDTDDPDINEVLEIRSETSKTSTKKYIAMKLAITKDNRLKGMFQYCGANRTHRWAGRIVQPHNLPKNTMKCLDEARQLVKYGDLESAEIVFGNVNYMLSQLIRTAFIADKDKTLLISDFSAIEARVIAWLCGEQWRLDVFSTHGKIYEASAAMMFKVPIESVTKGSLLRDKGKVAELALGYQGAVGALERMGGAKMGLDEAEMLRLVKLWRKENRKIVKFWYDIEAAVKDTIITKRRNKVRIIETYMDGGILFIKLPSGKSLAYLKPEIGPDDQIKYFGVDQVKKIWLKIPTYGGKLAENIVQAIARDCLAYTMLQLDNAGFDLVLHVHDEVGMEVLKTEAKRLRDQVDKIMSQPIPWAPGLLLKGESFISNYYKKED